MRPRWRNILQPRHNQPPPTPSKGATISAAHRPRLLLSLLLLTTLSASLAIGLIPAATGNQQALAASTLTTTWPTLRYGARGTAVVYLQRRLTGLHYDVGGIDGIFGYN
ncbi:MAG TPA: peptidoglycan-binding domain-containing protein, partial [Actinomycetota bacterium]|nr:peptidoglycan-binding domain-containing protein [Actinomycetota bacterium]